MHENTIARPWAARLLALAALSGGLLLSGPGSALAKEYEVVNTPPPMPEAMQQPQTAPAAPQNALPVSTERKAYVNGEKVSVREAYNNDTGFAVPDSDGGFIWMPAPSKSMSPGHADARELKLKVRELAS